MSILDQWEYDKLINRLSIIHRVINHTSEFIEAYTSYFTHLKKEEESILNQLSLYKNEKDI